MALILPQSSSSFAAKKSHLVHHTTCLKPAKFSVKSQQYSSTDEDSSGPSSKNSGNTSTGQGFGPSDSSSALKKKPQKGKRPRASIIRREPVEKPSFATPKDVDKADEMVKNESAFLLAWLGLGAIIIVEGIALAASGFLPEAWDGFFVKYLYPSFTPTVFLFVAGTVGYGVLKYSQNEKSSGGS